MYRFLTPLALAVTLVACTGQGDGATDRSPEVTTGTTPAATGSPNATGETGQGTAGSTGSGSASAACSEAFAPLGEMQLTSITELGDLSDEVEPTIEACESVDDWIAGARDVIADDVNPNTARLLLRMNCDGAGLSRTEICRELASS